MPECYRDLKREQDWHLAKNKKGGRERKATRWGHIGEVRKSPGFCMINYSPVMNGAFGMPPFPPPLILTLLDLVQGLVRLTLRAGDVLSMHILFYFIFESPITRFWTIDWLIARNRIVYATKKKKEKKGEFTHIVGRSLISSRLVSLDGFPFFFIFFPSFWLIVMLSHYAGISCCWQNEISGALTNRGVTSKISYEGR